MLRSGLLVAGLSGCLLGGGVSAASSPNLILDGGFEEVRRQPLFQSPYLDKAVKAGVQLAREGEDAILPANFSQFAGATVLKVVEGRPGDGVHSGTKALLLHGGMYLNPATPASYKTKEGDMYRAEFYAKGRGDVALWLHVTGNGKVSAVRLENRGKADPSRWTKIEHTFLIVGAGAQEIFPRLSTAEDVLIDDVVLRKVSADSEGHSDGQPASPRERSKAAFVYPLSAPLVRDGKLDDRCWQDVPAFSGFLRYGDQSLLAEPATAIKLGYDAENLYLRIACSEPEMSVVSLLDRYPDLATAHWIDPTAVEVFLDPGGTRLNYYYFSATARGHKYQSFKMDATFSAPWEVRTRLEPAGYTLLMRIPFATLGVGRPAVGDVWGLNVCRHRETTHSTWSPVGAVFHNPAGFGQLVFGSFDEWYSQAFLRGVKQNRGAILDRARKLGLSEIGARVALVDAYAAEVTMQVEKSAARGPKDGPEIARLYALGGFTLESYRRILTYTDWAALGAEGDQR